MQMNIKYIATMVAALAVLGMTMPATAADLATIMQNPQQFEGKKVSITAPIMVNMVPEGGEYRTWTFVLDACRAGKGLKVAESGFNPETIEEAYRLVEEARLRGDQLTVTGKLEKGDLGMQLALDSVTYGDVRVKTDEGPFVEDYYGDDVYPGTPRFYAGSAYYGTDFPEVEPPPPHIRFARISGCPTQD